MAPADFNASTVSRKILLGPAEIRTFGRGPRVDLERLGEGLETLDTERLDTERPDTEKLATAWLEQIHSAKVVKAQPGPCGPGDALRTEVPGLALCIVTADCVPVVLVGGGELAVIHAGWRGIVGGIVPATVATLRQPPRLAWIGPAIGPCCYEVGAEVAVQIERATGDPSAVIRSSRRPHVDLQKSVELQLRARGAGVVMTDRRCTHCSPDLWSYRRDGEGAGRNVTAAWLRPTQAPS